jgi:voltage-gated sodium channel
VVGVALIPATGSLSVLRALRILSVLRIISMVPSLKRVVGGLVSRPARHGIDHAAA